MIPVTVHDERVEAIDRYFRGELTESEVAPLFDHIRGCAECKQAYDHWANAEGALCGASDELPLTPLQLDRVGRRLQPDKETRGASGWMVRGSALAFASVLAITVAWLVIPNRSPPGSQAIDTHRDSVWGTRGGPTASAASVRLLAVSKSGPAPDVRSVEPRGAISRGSEVIQVVYTSEPGFDKADLYVETAEGKLRKVQDRLRVRATNDDKRLGAPIAVPADWPMGRIVVVAIFYSGQAPKVAGLKAGAGPGWVARTVEARVAPAAPRP